MRPSLIYEAPRDGISLHCVTSNRIFLLSSDIRIAISVFPIVVNAAAGNATIELEQRDVLLWPRRVIMLKAGLPRAKPCFLSSLQIAITVAVVGSITAEFVSEFALG